MVEHGGEQRMKPAFLGSRSVQIHAGFKSLSNRGLLCLFTLFEVAKGPLQGKKCVKPSI